MSKSEINTEGGTFVKGDADIGRDFVGRDVTKTTNISGNLIVTLIALLIVGIIALIAVIRPWGLLTWTTPTPQMISTTTLLPTTPPTTNQATPGERPASIGCPPPPLYAESENFDESMIEIPGREFVMGYEDSPFSSPKHKVVVDTFFIDKYEVTNRQYQRFVSEVGYAPPESWSGPTFPTGQAFYPVTGVTWQDAVAYCAWAGKRLMREDEWELACQDMAVEQESQDQGDNLYSANTAHMSCGGPITVGSFVTHEKEQVADLIGNVNEWVHSLDRPYPYDRDDGREDENMVKEKRVIRGGAYDIDLLSCTKRLFSLPDIASTDVGFRCAK